MRSKKVNIFKITAVFLIILAAVFYYYEEMKEPEIEEIPQTNVVAISKDVPENTVITEDMIVLEARYADDIKQTNVEIDINKIIGKRTLTPLYKGEILTTDRLIKNEPHMNNKDQKQIIIQLSNDDKALEFKKGDYIDIWIEPTKHETETQQIGSDENGVIIPIKIESEKIFEKLIIVELHDANYNQNVEIIPDNEITAASNEVYVTTYITITLEDEDIKEYYNIDKSKYSIRVTHYGEEKKYGILKNIQQSQLKYQEEQ